MTALYLQGGVLLVVDGSLATSSECCCYCPGNTWYVEIDVTGADKTTEIDPAFAVAGDNLGESGWSLRVAYYDEGPGGAPQTMWLWYQCCNDKPTGPGNPSGGTNTCDDQFMEDWLNDFINDNLPGYTASSNPPSPEYNCATADGFSGVVDEDNGMAGSREVVVNNGCLDCCGNETWTA